MSQNVVPEIDKQDLRRFFKENENEDVGTPEDCNYCPLATYFWKRYRLDIIVGNTSAHIRYAPETKRKLETWEGDFVRDIDHGTYEKPDCVYGSDAIEVLDEVLAREEEENS